MPNQKQATEERALQQLYRGYQGVDNDYVHAGPEALDRWMDWKFGLRIHWGLYSMMGSSIGESWLLSKLGHPKHLHETLPMLREQYEQVAEYWNPSAFDAEQWCAMMVRAGIKYFTFTCKHHDGFSMYDTQTTVPQRVVHTGPRAGQRVEFGRHYSIMETPLGRDVTGELIHAARARDLGTGLYFSHVDWFDPDFRINEFNYQLDSSYTRRSDPEGFRRLISRHRAQIRELCTRYGPIDLMSFDMSFFPESGLDDDIIATVKMARILQPQMLMRNRGIGAYGDYKTPEGAVPRDPNSFDVDDAAPLAAEEKLQDIPWQVIFPGGKTMGYVWGDVYKPARWIIETLVDVVAKGGNFQVGYGPGPSGTWDKAVVNRLEAVGNWLKVNSEAIYGTRPYAEFAQGRDIRFTRSKNGQFVYVFLLNWPGRQYLTSMITLDSVRAKNNSTINMLGLDEPFRYEQDDKKLTIMTPDWFSDRDKRPCHYVYTVKIEVD